MSKMNITPYITSEDISRYPDQASFKINTLIDNLVSETIDREKGDDEGSDNLAAEREARIEADNNLGLRIDSEAQTRANNDQTLGDRIDNLDDALDTEVTNRTNSDQNLQTQITALQNSELKLILTTTDPGAGSALAANTLLGVYV